LGIASRLN
jgi:hypothetical protein